MTVISSKEFATNQERYYDMALNEQVFIKKGINTFLFTCANEYEETDVIFEPDEEFYRSISGDEFKKKALEIVEKVHNRYSSK
jgi:hypothetical protein